MTEAGPERHESLPDPTAYRPLDPAWALPEHEPDALVSVETLAPRQFSNESVVVELPIIDPRKLPPLPRPNASLARGTTAVPITRTRGTLPPPIRASTESGLIPLTSYQPQQAVAVAALATEAVATARKPARALSTSDRTYAIRKTSARPTSTAWIIGGVVCAGMLVGYLLFRSSAPSSASTHDAPAASVVARSAPLNVDATEPPSLTTATSAPRAPLAMTQAVTPHTEVPRHMRVPIMTNPSGATVTLVDDGNARVIGFTPLDVTVDTTHSYDIVLALKGHPTTVRHFDPTSEHALAINLPADSSSTASIGSPSKSASGAHPAVAQTLPQTASAPTHNAPTAPDRTAHAAPTATVHHAPTAPVRATTTTTTASPAPLRTAPAAVTTSAPARTAPGSKSVPPVAPARVVGAPAPQPATKVPVATGILMVSTKPPCDIAIDGKATKLVAPQRAISVPVGIHRITLTNAHDRINRSIDVRIGAGLSTKLIEDFTKK